jgi:hypothetical protein
MIGAMCDVIGAMCDVIGAMCDVIVWDVISLIAGGYR